MEFILLFVLGLLVGVILKSTFVTTSGVLLIDQHNPEKDVYRFEFTESLDKIPKKKIVHLKVDAKADLSQDKQPL